MTRTRRAFALLLPATLLAGLIASASPALAANIAVTTTAQSPGSSGDCTLGEAIQAANTDAPVDACAAGSGADVIALPVGTYTLTAVDHVSAAGPVALPDITSTITIDGGVAATTVIERSDAVGTPAFKLFYMAVSTANQCWPTCTLTLRDVVVQKADGLGGALTNLAGRTVFENSTVAQNTNGPTIRTTGRLTIRGGTTMTNNTSSTLGGVIRAEADAVLSDSTFSFNTGGTGGVLHATTSAPITVTNSEFQNNTAETGGVFSGAGAFDISAATFTANQAFAGSGGAIGNATGSIRVSSSYFNTNYASVSGGAIDSDAVLTVTSSTFQENEGGSGGAIAGRGTETSLLNSTFSANAAANDGGAASLTGGAVALANVTLAGNDADQGGGFAWTDSGGTLAVRNSLIATNSATTAGPDCYSVTAIGSQGYNLVGDATGCSITPGTGDQLGSTGAVVDPRITGLDNWGGSTKTHALAADSPAIDAANPAAPGGGGSTCEQFDQRGQARPRDGNNDEIFICDIGAYEGGTGRPLLTVEKGGTGTGLVTTASDSTIDCGNDCAETYQSGTSVTLVPDPTADSEFTDWAGCTTEIGDQCVVSIDSDKTVTATFTDILSTLSVTRTGAGQGSVSSAPAGIDCGSDCAEQVTTGDTLVLTAAASNNSTFSFWSGCDQVSGTSCTVTVGDDTSVFASFAPIMRTLSVAKSGGGSGTVTSEPAGIDCGDDCGESYQIFTQIKLTAELGPDTIFGGWSGCDFDEGLECTITLNANSAVSAAFVAPQYNLTVTKLGSSLGSIESTPAGIACPGTCNEDYDHGTQVTLTASPDANVDFTGWTGCDSTLDGDCIVSMTSAKDVTGSFAPTQRTLEVDKTGSGTGTVSSDIAGIDCGSDCDENYNHGTLVTLSVSVGANSEFGGWTGCNSLSGDDCTVLMSEAKNVIASFPLVQRTLTVTKQGAGSGTVTSDNGDIDCGDVCSDGYDHGSTVDLTAVAGPNSTFSSWDGCDSEVGNVCTITLNAAEAVTATFVPVTRTLTVTTSGDGVVTSAPIGISCGVDCAEDLDHGTSVVLTATPNGSYSLDSWTGCDSTSGNTCTVSMTGAKTVSATFTTEPRLLTVSRPGNGAGTVSSAPVGVDCGETCTPSFDSGESVVLTATEGANSTFTGWTGCDSSSTNTCTVAMNADREVTARFDLVQRTLTVQTRRSAGDSAAAGSVTSNVGGIDCAVAGDCTQNFDHGATVVLTATPAANNSFVGWTGCDNPSGSTCTMALDSPKTVVAEFHNTIVPTSSVSPPSVTGSIQHTFSYSVSPGSGLTATVVELWIDGPGAGPPVKVTEVSNPATSGAFDPVSLGEGDGSYEIFTRARNDAGNYEAAPGSPATLLLDTQAPESNITSPTTQYKVNRFTLSWASTHATDASGVDQVTLYVDGPGAGAATPVETKPGAAGGTFTYTVTEGAGSYSFYSIAEDGAGNTEIALGVPDATVTVSLCPGFESDARVHVVGTGANNKLEGTNAGEVFCGLGGNDVMRGRGGSDLFVGGSGTDTVTYSERKTTQAVVVTVNNGANDGQKNEKDHVSSGIEIVLGGLGSDLFTGDASKNTFKGGGGNDNLKGSGGADKLYGDKGRDKLDGGPAKDTCKTGESVKGCEVR